MNELMYIVSIRLDNAAEAGYYLSIYVNDKLFLKICITEVIYNNCIPFEGNYSVTEKELSDNVSGFAKSIYEVLVKLKN